MATASLSFHPRLSSLLPRRNHGDKFLVSFQDHPAIKDSIEVCGIPHTEVDVILVNDISVSFDCRLQDGDRVEIYPYACQFENEPLIRLASSSPRTATFALDVHLGKLARRLRMLGFDCFYRNLCDDGELIDLALSEKRIILTRDRGILKLARVKNGLLIRSSVVDDQVREVLCRYRLYKQVRPLSRCTICNGDVYYVEKEKVRHQLLPKTAHYYDEFYRCRGCQKLYWKGSHYSRIALWIEEVNRFFECRDLC